MTKILAVLVGVLGLLLLGTTAQAKPAPPAAPYALNQEIVTNTQEVAQSDQEATLSVDCPSGKVPTGGGYSRLQTGSGAGVVLVNRPTQTGWTVTWGGQTSTVTATVHVVCVAAAAPTS
jgi:hypothetical protein